MTKRHLPTLRAALQRVRRSLLVRGALSTRLGVLGLILLGLLVVIAVMGPVVSPHSATAVVGFPFAGPSWNHPFGTDELGRDALARFLAGGGTLLAVTFGSTLLAYVVALPVGLAAGYRRGLVELATIGSADFLIAFPPIVLLLLVAAGAGSGVLFAALAIAAIQIPRIVRLARAATLDASTKEYVEAAVARGERVSTLLRREILPNIWSPILADFGIRLTSSALLFASVSFLGLGAAPPSADWGLMISENRSALLVQPWVIIPPAAAIALLTVSVNLTADAVARSVGRSIVHRGI